MKAIRILNRSLRDAFKSVFRNFSLSIASITCIAITLVLVAVSLVLSSNVNQFTKDIENEFGFAPLTVIPENDIFIEDDEKKKGTRRAK